MATLLVTTAGHRHAAVSTIHVPTTIANRDEVATQIARSIRRILDQKAEPSEMIKFFRRDGNGNRQQMSRDISNAQVQQLARAIVERKAEFIISFKREVPASIDGEGKAIYSSDQIKRRNKTAELREFVADRLLRIAPDARVTVTIPTTRTGSDVDRIEVRPNDLLERSCKLLVECARHQQVPMDNHLHNVVRRIAGSDVQSYGEHILITSRLASLNCFLMGRDVPKTAKNAPAYNALRNSLILGVGPVLDGDVGIPQKNQVMVATSGPDRSVSDDEIHLA